MLKTPTMSRQLRSLLKSERACRAYLERVRFGAGDYCVHCGYPKINRFNDGKRFRCVSCKRDFTIQTRTVFGESKIPLRTWLLAVYLLSIGQRSWSSRDLAGLLEVTPKTARFMRQRICRAVVLGTSIGD